MSSLRHRATLGGLPTIPETVSTLGVTLVSLNGLPAEDQVVGLMVLTETLVAAALAMSLALTEVEA